MPGCALVAVGAITVIPVSGEPGLKRVDRPLGPIGGEHHQVAGLVDGEVDRVEAGVALQREAVAPRSSRRCDGTCARRTRACRPARRRRRRSTRSRRRAWRPWSPAPAAPSAGGFGSGGHVEHGELALAHLQAARHVHDRVLVRELAGAQEGGRTLAVAGPSPLSALTWTLRKRMPADVLEAHGHRGRLEGAGDAIAVVVGDEDVARVADVEAERVGTLADFLLRSAARAAPSSRPGSGRSRPGRGARRRAAGCGRASSCPRRRSRTARRCSRSRRW